MKLWAMPVQPSLHAERAPHAAEIMQADLRRRSAWTAEIVTYEWAEYLKRSREKWTTTVP